MGFIDRLFHRPEPAAVRYVVANREESRKARIARVHTTLQLEVAVARLSPEEKRAAVERGKRANG
jgi:hypothetical protein